MSYTSPLSLFIEDLSVKMESDMENAVMKMALKVNATADKFELLRALEYDRGQYEAGEWDMFNLITSAQYGKQCYFLETGGRVYSRYSCQTLESVDEAVREWLSQWEG